MESSLVASSGAVPEVDADSLDVSRHGPLAKS